MRMARVNMYLPDELAEQVKDAGLNVSGIAQEALRVALDERASDEWLDKTARLGSAAVTHDDVIAAIDEARDEFGTRGAA